MREYLLALLLLWPVSLMADYQAGLNAYARSDYETAYRELLPLAEQGHAGAQFYLGEMYADVSNLFGDYAEAMKWTRLAAEQGHAGAQFNLGSMYAAGKGVTRDYTEAARWYRLAAEQGLIFAQSVLGGMYHEGRGVPQDYAKALKWYRLAVEHENSDVSQYEEYALGLIYDELEDYVRAYAWFNVAAVQGHKESAANRDSVQERMTPAQIAEAQKLSRELLERINK